MKRLFFALWPDHKTRLQCWEITRQLSQAGLRLVRPENLHVTLVFVGAVDPRTEAALIESADSITPFKLSINFNQISYWPKPGILCLTGQALDSKLQTLVSSLARSCESRGIKVDQRPYAPHITVARKAKAASACEFEPFVWHADSFCLVQSISGSNGSIYQVIREWTKK